MGCAIVQGKITETEDGRKGCVQSNKADVSLKTSMRVVGEI